MRVPWVQLWVTVGALWGVGPSLSGVGLPLRGVGVLLGMAADPGVTQGARDHLERDTSGGRVRGYLHHVTKLQAATERYFAIPYAAPPVGSLRLEPPQPPDPWQGVLNATELSPACLQSQSSYIMYHNPAFKGGYSEDCLYLNIYLPALTSPGAGLPVLVYVHGGSNLGGMGAMLHGDTLAILGKMVIVNFNYRLGPLGFMGLGEEGFRGNLGLLDQNFVLRWVKDNIRHFGGDPTKVTLQGHSSGSADTGVHILSPLSRGLFRYAVLQSGSPLSFFGVEQLPWSMRNYTLKQASTLRCDVKAPAHVIKECLKSASPEALGEVGISQYTYMGGFAPVAVDGHVLPARPDVILRNDAINGEAFMIGVTADDGGKEDITAEKYASYRLESEFENALPPTDLVHLTPGFVDMVRYEYTPRGLQTQNGTTHAIAFGYLHGDGAVRAPALRMADLLSARGLPTYFYSFEVDTATKPEIGVPHGHDIFYLWGAPLVGHPLWNYGDVERDVSMEVTEVWSHFIQSGIPRTRQGTQLLPYSNATLAYFQIAALTNGSAVVRQLHSLRAHQVALWNEALPSLAERILPSAVNRASDLHSFNLSCRLFRTICCLLMSKFLLYSGIM